MQALGNRRSVFTKSQAIPVATPATSAQVLTADPSRSGVALLNKSDAVVSVFLCALADKATSVVTVELAAGAYWEDPHNYTGPIIVEGAGAGNVNATEWFS